MPEPSVRAARRSAWRRRGASAYAWPDVRGVRIGAATSSAPDGVDAAAGDPVAVPTAPKLWNTEDCNTPDTAWRSELSCCGLARCAWGPVLSLQAAATSAAAAARPGQGRPCRAGMLLLRNVSVSAAVRVRGPRQMVQAGTYPIPHRSDRDRAHAPPMPDTAGTGRRLRDHTAAEQAPLGVVQGAGLPGRDRAYGLGELEPEHVALALPHPAGHGLGPVPALHERGVARRQGLGQPVHLAERYAVAEQLVARPDHHLARFRTDRDHVHRLTESAGEPAALPDGVAGEAGVLTYDVAARRDQRSGSEGGRVRRKMPLQDSHVVVVGDEANLD